MSLQRRDLGSMAQKHFKQFIYWFVGERAGRVLTATWSWLWGLPVESGGKIAVEVAQESLETMQKSVAQLTQSVASLMAAYQQAKSMYESRQKEFRQAEQQAILAQQQGNAEAARMAMTKAILLDRSLPSLAEKFAKAETVVRAAKDRLNRERQKLETYKLEMQNLKDLAELNEALAVIDQANTELEIGSARSQFATAQTSIERRHLQMTAQAELSENPAEKLTADLAQMTLDDEIAQRLQRLTASSSSSRSVTPSDA
ncbi:PspA/IM30 family protein [Trichocoleus sp. FACHB-262]|uniref:PspA/IM30 family protein n=1 Tax=Trichocoleus sp. FACHB-262 TaxID=2692869 RepID=UPI001F55060E|nr:PspA/IM30 family protein [Trichocoleus sp. FACHB-262]